MCDKHARSGLLGSLLLSVAILFSNSSGGHAETITKEEFRCLHVKTLARVDQLIASGGQQALDFLKDQMRSGECSGSLEIGTSVRS
jgi:hypothetical protein